MQIVGEHGRSGHWRYPADALLPRPPLFCAPAELLKVSVGLPAGFLRFVSVGKKKKNKKPTNLFYARARHLKFELLGGK